MQFILLIIPYILQNCNDLHNKKIQTILPGIFTEPGTAEFRVISYFRLYIP